MAHPETLRLQDPSTAFVSRRLELAALAVCLVVAVFALLRHAGAEPLDHGYTRYGSIAEHMVRTGDYVVPWLGDEIYVLKPPLQSWIIALPIVWLGYLPNWATHLPNLLGATASLIATWFLARRVLGSARGATLAALILATMTTFVEHSRGERVDPLFADSLVTALAFFHAAVHDSKRSAGRWIFAAWLALIVALYTKGPFGPLFFLLVALPYSIVAGKARILVSKASLTGFLVAVSAFAAWPCALISRIGIDRARELFAAAEFAQKIESWWFYGAAIPKAILPWIVFLPALVLFVRQKRPRGVDAPLMLPLLWIAVFVVMLQFSTAKAERYLLPLLAPVSIVLAAMFLDATGRARDVVRITGLLSAAVLALAAAIAPFLPRSFGGVPVDAVPATTLAGVAAIVAVFGFLRHAPGSRAPLALALGFLLAYSGNDLQRAKKLAREDGRDDAVRALSVERHPEPIQVAEVPANDQGMIESIVRRPLPRTNAARPAGLVLTQEGSEAHRRYTAATWAERIDSLRLDEIDYGLWRLRASPAQ